MDAAGLELGGLRVLVLVDHVLVDGEVHDLVDLGLDPGLAEGGQVLAGVAVEHQLVDHHLVGVAGVLLLPGEPELRHRDREVAGCVDLVGELLPYGLAFVQHPNSSL